MSKVIPLSFFLLSLIFIQCTEQDLERQAVVSVGERFLYLDELEGLIPLDASSEDSTFFVDQYIESWIRNQVVLVNAEERLPEEEKDFTEELKLYRNSLLNYAYERAIVNKSLDTLVSDEELEAYYHENEDNFILKDYIVQAKFCILSNEIEELKEFKSLFRSDKAEDLVLLEQYCVQNNASYYIDIEEWLYVSELQEMIPLEIYNKEKFLRQNKYVDFKDEEKLYFLKIENYKLKDSQSPLSLQKANIKNMILNKRKNKLVIQLKEDLYKDAFKKGEIKRYLNNE